MPPDLMPDGIMPPGAPKRWGMPARLEGSTNPDGSIEGGMVGGVANVGPAAVGIMWPVVIVEGIPSIPWLPM